MRLTASSVSAVSEKWNHRSALRLSNGAIEVILLRGGGHIAELRLITRKVPSRNCLWAAPWATADPGNRQHAALARAYGGGPKGQFLAGYTGHTLCLDIFGPPSAVEAVLGLPFHGGAASRSWTFEVTEGGCIARVGLPVAHLSFQRTVTLATKAPVLFIDEQVHNRGKSEREIHWVQHVSLGPPFVMPISACIYASIDRAIAWPGIYESRELLQTSSEFCWPTAPAIEGGAIDLQTPFWRRGFGFVVAARVNIDSEYGFISALNAPLGMALIYCFRRSDFPWVEVWEENCARHDPPWNSVAQVRGMNFGTTPVPLGREGVHKLGKLFGLPGAIIINPGAALRARYIACIARIPSTWTAITNVIPTPRALKIVGPTPAEVVSIRTDDVKAFLKGPAAA